MKKIMILGVVFALFTVAASAQKSGGFRDQRHHPGYKTGQLTRGEKARLHKNDVQYKKMHRKFKKDGRLSPMEKRKLSKMRKHDRRETFRYRHNDRRKHS